MEPTTNRGPIYIFKNNEKISFFGRKKIAGLTRKSYIPAIKEIWKTFDTGKKADWKAAGEERGINGWQAFVADQSQRIKFGIEGEATPSTYHQDYVGAIIIEEPAEEVKITQLHPAQYWVNSKVQGKKAMYEPVSVTEAINLPLILQLNYKSNLVSTGEGSFAKYYAEIRHSYQGVNRTTNLEVNLTLDTNWTSAWNSIGEVLGAIQGYNLYIHLNKVTGTLLFDNIIALHSAQNWVRDTYCKDISKTFTKAFYQIPQNWAAVILPIGAAYNSAYPE